MSNQIEIKITAKRLTPEKFLEGAKEFCALIQGVAKNVTHTPIKWSVELDSGSNVMRMRAENPTAESENSLDLVSSGVRALRGGISTVPLGFTKREVEAAKILAALNDGEDVQSVSIQNGSSPEDMPLSIVEVANAILVRESHDAFGSVEGKVVSLSARQGFICIIYDPIERREITCYLQKPELRAEIIKGFEKEVRVLAGGLIHYSKEGHPVNITVDAIRLFPPDSELPTVLEIQEIYKIYK